MPEVDLSAFVALREEKEKHDYLRAHHIGLTRAYIGKVPSFVHLAYLASIRDKICE